jgi:hypothetical protein
MIAKAKLPPANQSRQTGGNPAGGFFVQKWDDCNPVTCHFSENQICAKGGKNNNSARI